MTAGELGLVLGAIGAFTIALGVIKFLRDPSSMGSYQQRRWTLVGALVMEAGFLVQLAGKLK